MLVKQEIKIKQEKLTSEKNEQLANIFSILGDKNRLQIIQLLMRNTELCVTDLANILEISISAISHQLRILEMGGLVTKKRTGQIICYNVKKDHSIIKILNKLI